MDEDNTKIVKNSFINHVFNFDNDTKCELLNVGQYSLLAILPMGFYSYIVDNEDIVRFLRSLFGKLG